MGRGWGRGKGGAGVVQGYRLGRGPFPDPTPCSGVTQSAPPRRWTRRTPADPGSRKDLGTASRMSRGFYAQWSPRISG